MSADRLCVYRKNGKCIIDTVTEEDEEIYFEINHEKVSLDYLLSMWKAKTPEKSCETCGRKPAFGSPTLLAVHCLICKDGCSQWEKIVVADQKKSMCDWHHDSIKRLGLLFDELEKKVKALEDRHREIPKVIPICPKPCYCKFPGQLPAMCYHTCAGTHCVYHKEHKG